MNNKEIIDDSDNETEDEELIWTDTEDSESVDLDDYEDDDEEDLRQGEIEYEKYKHALVSLDRPSDTLSDFIVDDSLEYIEPVNKKRKINDLK